MGSARSRLTGTAHQLEKQAHRVRSPRHPGHRDPEPVITSKDLLKKDSALHERLKGLRAEPTTIEVHKNFPDSDMMKSPSGSKIVVTQKKVDPSLYKNLTPDEVPPGKLNMDQLITLFTLHQHKGTSVEELAENFKLDSEIVQDLVDNFGLFATLRKEKDNPPSDGDR